MRYEFTTSAALELIKTAAEFERVDVDPSAFLNDLVESVCLLQVDGLMYKFTHRSFQEYFAAVFITRGPAIDLGALLDNLADRRSDVVIPMAIDMNRNLIEREWVLPGVRSIASMVPDTPSKALAFAEHVFGNVSRDGTRMVQGPASPVLTRLAYFKDLYPNIITKLDGFIGLSHEDREKVKSLWQQLCAQWWEHNRGKLKTNNSWQPARGGKWLYTNDVFLTAYRQVILDGKSSIRRKRQANTANGEERALFEMFVEECNRKFYDWQDGRRQLTPDKDAEWFSITSNAARLMRLGEEVIALHKHIESSLDYSRSTGTKLLD